MPYQSEVILEMRNICKTFPGVKALDHARLTLHRGEVHALIGENGAGKSTLMKILLGIYQPDAGEGEILYKGQPVHFKTPHDALQAGISMIHQEINLIPTVSVGENIWIGRENKFTKAGIISTKKRNQAAQDLLDRLGIEIDAKETVRNLSVANMQLVELARSVSYESDIISMDEPTSSLSDNEIELLYKIVRELSRNGTSVIFISHKLEEIFEVCDRVTVMRDGQYIKTLNIKDTCRKELVDLMVGRELTESYPSRKVDLGEEVLRVEHLTGNGVEDINFSLKKGEILGFGGLVGAGRTELMNVIYGADKLKSGTIYLSGKPVHFRDTADALAKGIGMIPEDRKRTGVFLKMSIRWNSVICALKSISHLGIVNTKKEKEIADYYIKRLKIRTPSPEQLAGNLSGGNQQKVVLAKAMAAQSQILIFDEPTRGVDVGAKQEIYQLMNQLVEEGHSILMVSSDMPELLGMSDRIVVICEGRQAGIVPKAEFSQARILDLASGEK